MTNISDTIQQKKLDSLAAKHLHVKRRMNLNRWSQFVDYLGLAVPVIYFAVRYLAKGTTYEWLAQVSWELLASLLLALALLKLVYRWQDKAQRHSELLGENISLVGQADRLLVDPTRLSTERAELFLLMAQKSERDDRDALGAPPLKDKQFAYREALKEVQPGNVAVVCPGCHSSPWRFAPGSCQICGNSPTITQSKN